MGRAPSMPNPISSLEMMTRAVNLRPAMVLKVRPIDMNIVFQRLPLEESAST